MSLQPRWQRWLNFRIQFDVILAPSPGITRIIQQIVQLIFVAFRQPKFLDRHMHERGALEWIAHPELGRVVDAEAMDVFVARP